MMDAIRDHDPDRLDDLLHSAALQFTMPAVMEDVVAPLLRGIGEGTRDGSLRIAQEHIATAQIRTFLGSLRPASVEYQEAPKVVVTTPSGQLHELGALMVSVTCASEAGHRFTWVRIRRRTKLRRRFWVRGQPHWGYRSLIRPMILACPASCDDCVSNCPRVFPFLSVGLRCGPIRPY